MIKNGLSQHKQNKLIELFVAGIAANRNCINGIEIFETKQMPFTQV